MKVEKIANWLREELTRLSKDHGLGFLIEANSESNRDDNDDFKDIAASQSR